MYVIYFYLKAKGLPNTKYDFKYLMAITWVAST